MADPTDSEHGDEATSQNWEASPPDLPEAVHLLNSTASDFLNLGVRRRSKMAINVVLDGILLIFFTAFSYGMDALLHYFDLEGVSATARDAISVIFAIGTIGFALLMMIADLIEIAKELFG